MGKLSPVRKPSLEPKIGPPGAILTRRQVSISVPSAEVIDEETLSQLGSSVIKAAALLFLYGGNFKGALG